MAWLTLPEQLLGSSGAVNYIIFTIFVVIASIWLLKRRQKVWMLSKIPGPKGLPILGNLLEFRLESKELFAKITSFGDYGNIVKVWLGHQPYIFLFGASEIETVLSGSKFLEKSFDYTFIHPWLGTGLLTSTGGKWHSRRKMLTPAFHFKILEDFVDVFNAQSRTLTMKLEGEANGKPFNIFPYVTRCTLDIICETAMGTSINAQDASESSYIDAIYKIGYMIQQRVAHPWQHSDFLYKISGLARKRDDLIKILHDFTLRTIAERKKAFADRKTESGKNSTNEEDELTKPKKRLAFLDLLLEYSQNGQILTDEDIREEVDTFMFEGHDTTTAAINWSLFLLGLNPEIQHKVHEELDVVFGDTDREVTPDDLRELKYLENCIKEALRIYPSVPFFGRQVREEVVVKLDWDSGLRRDVGALYKKFKVVNDVNHPQQKLLPSFYEAARNYGYRIPADTPMTVVTYRLHRDPKCFPNPEVYDPDRFLPENTKGRHPFAYIPFSAGPRNCIGQKFAMMEEKIILSTILRKFRVESHETRDQIDVLGELILRPADGINIKLFKRTNAEE